VYVTVIQTAITLVEGQRSFVQIFRKVQLRYVNPVIVGNLAGINEIWATYSKLLRKILGRFLIL